MNACGFEDIFDGVLGSAVTRCLGLTMSMTGVTEQRAAELGYSPVSATVTKNDKVGYMPDANNITLKVVADKKQVYCLVRKDSAQVMSISGLIQLRLLSWEN